MRARNPLAWVKQLPRPDSEGTALAHAECLAQLDKAEKIIDEIERLKRELSDLEAIAFEVSRNVYSRRYLRRAKILSRPTRG